MRELFIYDERLGISIPDLNLEWDEYTKGEQQQILVHWENIRGASRTASRNWNPRLTESSFGSPMRVISPNHASSIPKLRNLLPSSMIYGFGIVPIKP